MQDVMIPKGVFSRLYRLKDGLAKCVVYNTPYQSIALLDGDSAEVWQLLYNSKGNSSGAIDYIVKNGKFKSDDKLNEAQDILSQFIESLKQLNLLVAVNDAPVQKAIPKNLATINERISPLVNRELSVSQMMADSHVLYSLVLELTYRCNERCIHCYCPSNRDTDEISTVDIENLLIQFKELGGFRLQLTGGEIFIRKDIKEILNIVKDSNLVLDITSNLTLMADDTFEIINEIKPRCVGCSIYSSRPDLHDETTGLGGSFERSIKSIKRLRSAGIPVVIKTPLMSHTAKYWRDIEILANELGCDYQLDLNITAKNDGSKEPVGYRVMDKVILTEIMSSRFYKIYLNDEPMGVLKSPSPDAILCGAGLNGLAISPDGVIRPCIGMSERIGNIRQDTLDEVWNGSGFLSRWVTRKLADIKKCLTCAKIAYCNRCPGAWFAENGRYDAPVDYTCYLADVWCEAQNINKS